MNLVILGSHRRDSDTEKVMKNLSPFDEYEVVNLLDVKIQPYLYDSATRNADDFLGIADKMLESENIIFATPVYWYSMSSLMKNFFDRMTDLVTTNKNIGKALKGRNGYLIASGGGDELPDGFEIPFRLTCEYFGMKFVETKYQKMKG